jgi:ribokinase
VDVVVLGSANADLIVRVARRPGPGETVLGSDTEVLPGGKGANVAVAAARLGASVALLGAVGTDANGDLLLDSLRSAGVATDRVRRSPRPTGTAYITVDEAGENSIIVSPGANADVNESDVDISGAAVLTGSLEVPVPVVAHAIRLAVRSGVRAVLNLSPVAEFDAFEGLDPLVVNEHEAESLGGDPAKLLALGPRSVVITKGGDGALLITTSGVEEIPAPRVEVVDTTGAGDAFVGAVAASLAAGTDLPTAVRLAVRVASTSVTARGAQPSYPTRADLPS